MLIAAYDPETNRFIADRDGCIDAVLEILILAYVYGTNNANQQLGTSLLPDDEAARTAILREYDGKNFADRVAEYFDAADIESIVRVADTDSHRVFCAGQYDTALRGGATEKTWLTRLDFRVRETHEYIEGVTVGINDKFYTIDGDEALHPGGFRLAQNNVNCRCELRFS